MDPIKIVVCGSKGRMGKTVIECASKDRGLQVVGEIDVGDSLETISKGDVVIDFSSPQITRNIAYFAVQAKKPLIIGTTGHEEINKASAIETLRAIPCVWTGNFSEGVNIMFWLTEQVARITGEKWNVEIVETHHTAKKDAPSGTAKGLQAAIRCGNGKDAPAHSLRIGDVVGEHTVTFGTPGERLELTHRASSRVIFANGALSAAKWIIGRPPGLYDMMDVLGLRK